MISLSYLFEEEKSTKLSVAEKVTGGVGIASGAGIYALAKKLQRDEAEEPMSIGEKMLPPEIHNAYQDDVENLKNIGLATVGTITGALAAHKLYKMYKNKKK